MKILAPLALIGLSTVLPTLPALAREPMARCVIETRQTTPYRGPCMFITGRGGSFTVSHPDGERLVGDVVSISVEITARGRAEVRGSVHGGPNSRWGAAVRDANDRACWVKRGDFRVCAY